MIPDSGRNYLSKFFDDNWMLEHGFIERQAPLPTVDEVLRAKHGDDVPALVTISAHQKVGEGIDTMQRYGISQLPGRARRRVRVARRRHRLAAGSRAPRARVHESRRPARGRRERDAAAARRRRGSATVDEVFATLTGGMNAVVVARDGKPVGVLTRSDLLEFLAHRR